MEAHLFKVSFFREKKIFRRIACLGEQTFDDLHLAIFSAFDREEEHLYSFYFPFKPTKSIAIIRRKSVELCHPMAIDDWSSHDQYDASEEFIGSTRLDVKQKFYYLFDYGDEWWHEVTYEGVENCKEKKYPAILLKKGESPPQYPEYDEYIFE